MQQAIVRKPHGRPGARLIPLNEAMEDIEAVARLYMCEVSEMKRVFAQCGFNTFNPKWAEYLKKISSI